MKVVFILVILLVIGVIATICIGLVSIVVSIVSGSIVSSKLSGVKVETIPKIWTVDKYSITPAKDQMSRGTCWIFSIIGFLESSYRSYGHSKGYLNDTEYVSFSEQGFGIGAVDLCKNSDASYCFQGPQKGKTEDGTSCFLYYWRNYIGEKVFVLPETACPYFNKEDIPDYEFRCENYNDTIDDNPISFEVKNIESAYSVSEIKSLMYRKNSPLTWEETTYDQIYYYPCEGEYNSLDMCVKCMFPCSYNCCVQVNLKSYTNEGVFDIFTESYPSGGHAMLLVGWNDDFRVDRQYGDFSNYGLGGFIVKNSWGSSYGHSLDYWAMKHSRYVEQDICPNVASSINWFPLQYTCFSSTLDNFKCSGNVVFNNSRGTLKGATRLKCTVGAKDSSIAQKLGTTLCTKEEHGIDYDYYLAAEEGTYVDGLYPVWIEIPPNSNGGIKFHIIRHNLKTNEVIISETDDTSYGALEKLFYPAETINNTEECGFYFIPYDAFNEMSMRSPRTSHDTPAFSWFDIKWNDRSFLKKKNKKYNYDYVKSSTKNDPRTFYDSPEKV